MGKREKKFKAAKLEESSASEGESRKVQNPVEAVATDDDEEANEDLSLKIVQRSMLRACNNNSENDGVLGIVTDLKKEEKKEKKKRKKSTETEVPEHFVPSEIDKGFRDFCGELFLVDNLKGEEKLQTDKSIEVFDEAVEANPVEVSDNAVMRKLLRGPRYFDPPDNSWGACFNCFEEGHTTVNCTSARRKKPCFVCGSFEHNAKLCSKGRDCFICKQKGHRAKDCPEKFNISKICLKCGDLGHEMFSCENDYSPDDVQEIQCYVCHKFGHLCCADYGSPNQGDVSCYKCGRSGHTGLACTAFYRGDTNGTYASSSCFKCGGEGHFARECTSSVRGCDTNGLSSSYSCYKCGGEGHFARECITVSKKASKRIREPSTPKQKASKKIRDHKEVKSAPTDLGRTRKKKKSHHAEFSSPVKKTKHRGGWITEDPEYYYDYNNGPQTNYWRSPSTPSDRRSKMPHSYDDYGSTSHSRNPHRYNSSNYLPNNYSLNDYGSNNYALNRSSGIYQHSYSASRFGNSNNGGMRRNYDRW